MTLQYAKKPLAKISSGLGLCNCGCGQPAPIAKRNRMRRGHVKGQPMRFIPQHHRRGQKHSSKTRAKMAATKTVHGHARTGSHSRLYRTWISMWQRCTNPRATQYADWGGRGITVCERWSDFRNFMVDVGEKPVGMTLERINNNLGYFKENCRWATWSEQARNKRPRGRVTWKEITLQPKEWAQRLGISRSTFYRRLRQGWPDAQVFRKGNVRWAVRRDKAEVMAS